MMVTITMGNTISKIEHLTYMQKMLVRNELSYVTSGFGAIEETHYLFNINNNVTYTGLIPRVILLLKKNNITYSMQDKRIKPCTGANFKIVPEFSLRDYQEKIVNNASSREIIQAATGAGKTFIMANLIAKYNVKPVLVIVPKISLAMQIKDEFEKFLGIKICALGGGNKKIFGDIVVSTPQSCPDYIIKNVQMLLYDETHFLGAENIFKISTKAHNAYYRFGVSATPWRDDGKDLLIEAALNIRKPSLSIIASDLIKKQKLTPCTINFIQLKNEIPWQGSYDKTYNMAIVNNIERNNKILTIAMNMFNQNKTQLILIKNIIHGNKLLEQLKNIIPNITKNSLNTIEFLNGNDDLHRRATVLQSVKDGFTKILIASTIADEGLDVPILDCLILAGSGKSSTRAFQRVGRVIRLYKGKTNAIVYDFMDANLTFYKHSLFRKALYETEPEWEINII